MQRTYLVHAQAQGAVALDRRHFEPAGFTVDADAASIAMRVDRLDPRNATARVKLQHPLEIVRRSIRQAQLDGALVMHAPLATAEFTRRLGVGIDKCRVEATQARVAGSRGNGSDRQAGFAEQLLGKQQSTRCRDILRTGAKLAVEQAAQMALANADARGECAHRLSVERALLDQLQRRTHELAAGMVQGRAGSGLRPATQARAEARSGSGGSARIVGDVGRFWSRRGTHRAAIDASGFHGREEQAVKARIAGQPRLFAGGRIECRRAGGVLHGCNLAAIALPDSPFPDINGLGGNRE